MKNPFQNPGVLWNALRKRGLYSLGVKGSLGVAEDVHPQLAVGVVVATAVSHYLKYTF